MDDKINSTKDMPKPSVMASTLELMDEFDVNKLNKTSDKKKD